jgi:hypothetical protein
MTQSIAKGGEEAKEKKEERVRSWRHKSNWP